MFGVNITRTLLSQRGTLCIALRPLHSTVPCCAAVKKTTSAAGGVMGLGKGKKGKAGKLGAMEKKELPVETDPYKLVNQVCGSNIYVTGEDVKIKPDSEYPDWLWTLRTNGPPPIEELDPETKEYWLRVRAAGMRRNNKLRSMRKF
ncbi:mitochondrial ribosomal protein l37 domain-containing protein [Phthorimaea operculella]|nr:mitochondrial ribosomal protein l37 domain-containing protein [Phthorimaea operculella]